MSGESADEARKGDDLRDVPGWRRIGWCWAGVPSSQVCRRRCSSVAAWCAVVVLGCVFGQRLDVAGTWLDVVRSVLSAVLVLSYLGMLVLATRWRPAPEAQL